MQSIFRKYSPIVVLVLSLATSSCMQLYAQDFKIDDKIPIPIPGVSAERAEEITEADFVEGMKFYVIEQYDKALEQFMRIYKKQPENAGLLYQIAATNNKLKKTEKAIEFALKAYNLQKPNTKYAQLAAGLLATNAQYEAAANIYKEMFEADPNNAEVGLDLAASYYSMGEYEKELKVYHLLEKSLGIEPSLIHQKQNVLVKLNKIEDAIKEGDRLIAYEPKEIDHLLSQAEFLLKNNKTKEAEKYLSKAESLNPNNGQIHIMLAEIARNNKNFIVMYEHLAHACNDKNMDDGLLAKVIYSFLSDTPAETEAAKRENLLKILVEKQPNEPYGYLLLGDFHFGKEQNEAAYENYSKALQLEKMNNQLWTRVLALGTELNKHNQTIKLAEEALELYPNQALFWYYKGLAHYQNKQHTEAIENLSEAQRLMGSNKEIALIVYSLLAESYNRTSAHTQSDEAFDQALALDPNNDGLANNYAYYLSLRKQHLEKAQQLIEPVILRNPKNATFLDTYGWVLYIAKKYDKAMETLENAWQNSDKKSATIIDHLADACYQNNQKDKALQYWKIAADLSPSNKEIQKKIAAGRLIE
jgi:tetratricopeptide (TPR) repeat protein